MAKTSSYSDDLLISAVELYKDNFDGKIKATELAKWASENIPGLENVRDYNFTRPHSFKDAKTGKKKVVMRLCTIRIDEINKIRSLGSRIGTNVLLHASNPDEFLRLPIGEQRKTIIATRVQVEQLVNHNGYLERLTKDLGAENKQLKERTEKLENMLCDISNREKETKKKIKRLVSLINEEQSREALTLLGIANERIDWEVYRASVESDDVETFKINDTIKKVERTVDFQEEYINSIFDDIDE